MQTAVTPSHPTGGSQANGRWRGSSYQARRNLFSTSTTISPICVACSPSTPPPPTPMLSHLKLGDSKQPSSNFHQAPTPKRFYCSTNSSTTPQSDNFLMVVTVIVIKGNLFSSVQVQGGHAAKTPFAGTPYGSLWLLMAPYGSSYRQTRPNCRRTPPAKASARIPARKRAPEREERLPDGAAGEEVREGVDDGMPPNPSLGSTSHPKTCFTPWTYPWPEDPSRRPDPKAPP